MNYTKEVLSEPDGSIINKVVALCISFGSAGGKVWRVFWKGTSNQLPRMVGSLSLLGQPKLRSEAGAARDLPPRPVSSPGCAHSAQSVQAPALVSDLQDQLCQRSPPLQTFYSSRARWKIYLLGLSLMAPEAQMRPRM